MYLAHLLYFLSNMFLFTVPIVPSNRTSVKIIHVKNTHENILMFFTEFNITVPAYWKHLSTSSFFGFIAVVYFQKIFISALGLFHLFFLFREILVPFPCFFLKLFFFFLITIFIYVYKTFIKTFLIVINRFCVYIKNFL